MAKFMLDTNIYNLLVEEELIEPINSLSKKGLVSILTTPLQEEELLLIKEPILKKKARLLLRQVIPLVDYSAKEGKHWKDDLIVKTALKAKVVLVSDDKRLRERWQNLDSGLKIWSFAEFKEYLNPILPW